MSDEIELVPLNGLQPRQCSKTTASTGMRCRNHALPGQDICAAHGGNHKMAREAAQRRMEMVRSELFDTLVNAAEEATATYVNIMRYGKRDADKLKAADRILTLLGFTPNAPVIHIEKDSEKEHDDIDQRLLKLLAEAEEQHRDVSDIIDVEEVEDDDGEDDNHDG